MKTIGIVAEWNPFHNGHQHLLDVIRANEPEACIISIMSGAFCQRGEVACFDKWQRTEMALAAGVDVVLELPQCYATASLEAFAQGGISGLLAFYPLDALYCGSESGDSASLEAQATYLRTHSTAYNSFIHQATNDGTSYAEASQLFLRQAGFPADKNTPNDRLALHYRLALPPSIPMTLVTRHVAHHGNTASDHFMSASSIRQRLPQALEDIAAFVPASSYTRMQEILATGWQPANLVPLFNSLQVLGCQQNATALRQQLRLHDGWEHRLLAAIQGAEDFEQLLDLAQTRHYSRSRIRRLILSLLSPLTQAPVTPAYCRVLGFSCRGQALLRQREGQCPLLLNTAKDARHLSPAGRAMLQGDIQRQNLADVLTHGAFKNRDFLERPRIYKEEA